VAVGLLFRARATSGGTDILARILERRFGMPLSQAYLYTDGIVVFLAGLTFGWERALYAVIALYVGGVLVEVTLNGSNVMRVATIITNEPEDVADRILADKGIFVIPDILANSGGVIVSYFEWVQDLQRFFWSAADIQNRLQDIITSAFHRTLRLSSERRVSMRMAALMSGIDQVAQAHLQRGLYP